MVETNTQLAAGAAGVFFNVIWKLIKVNYLLRLYVTPKFITLVKTVAPAQINR